MSITGQTAKLTMAATAFLAAGATAAAPETFSCGNNYGELPSISINPSIAANGTTQGIAVAQASNLTTRDSGRRCFAPTTQLTFEVPREVFTSLAANREIATVIYDFNGPDENNKDCPRFPADSAPNFGSFDTANKDIVMLGGTTTKDLVYKSDAKAIREAGCVAFDFN